MYLPSRKACEYLGVCANTLRKWANEGRIKYIRTPHNMRLYDCSTAGDYHAIKKNYCYCRVTSEEDRGDLEKQKLFMERKYPRYTVLCDIGPTSDFKRKELLFILNELMHERVGTLVISHKDRLCNFGFELIDWLFTKNNAHLVVLHPDEHYNDTETQMLSKESEADMFSILASIIAKNAREDKEEREYLG